MKYKTTAAVFVALAIALGSCGGDDEQPSADRPTTAGTTGATGATKPAVKEQPSETGSDTTADSGGAKQPKSDGGNASTPSDNSSAGSGSQDSGQRDTPRKKPSSGKKKAAPTTIEGLSQAQREKLHKDLYEQGKTLCAAYTPAELAQQYNIHATRPEDVAREYAELYEQANPSLVLPYQQGCVAGFKQRAKQQRNAGEATGG